MKFEYFVKKNKKMRKKLKIIMSGKHVVIFKNDAVGDLVHSLKAINNICNEKNVDKITIYISKLKVYF